MSEFGKKSKIPETFAEALLGDLDLSHLSAHEAPVATPQLTEKAVVLESFTQFAEEVLAENPAGVVSFPGGELVKREVNIKPQFKARFTQKADWQKAQQARISEELWTILLGEKTSLSVLFIGEALREREALNIEGTQIKPEFLISFLPPIADLFQKMVQAMKLSPAEYALTALQDAAGEKTQDDLMEEIFWHAPRFVVPLGAKATQALLGARERLASIHGKFYPLESIEGSRTQVVPLFHPSVIASNSNMKKSTWTDMQKIMQALGKI